MSRICCGSKAFPRDEPILAGVTNPPLTQAFEWAMGIVKVVAVMTVTSQAGFAIVLFASVVPTIPLM
jgi:hypothetical protein